MTSMSLDTDCGAVRPSDVATDIRDMEIHHEGT